MEYQNFDHRQPDYISVLSTRQAKLLSLRANLDQLPAVKAYYRDNIADFINDWGMTFDPRNPEIGLPASVPFVLFPKQREWVDWIVERWKKREDGLTEKSRDMGMSWLSVSVAVSLFLLHPGVVIGFGSRKEEYVDKLGDPKSLFWKARQYIAGLPKEFRPVGWDESKHAPYMRILNPENGSSIVGEAGDNIGRGARASIYVCDEAAFFSNPESIDAALSQTSNCKIYVSTPNGNGNPFYHKRHSGKYPVFSFRWQDDPRKDQAWYDKQKAMLDPVILAQEVDIDYNASTSDTWISGRLVEEANAIGPADIIPVGGWRIGVDAAHMGDDVSVIHFRKGRLNLPQIEKRGVDGIMLAGVVVEECDKMHDQIEAIFIELDGPGVSCYDTLKASKYSDVVVGLHTGARVDDGKNYNVRAQLWRMGREYLESPPISLSASPELKSQLSAMRYKYKDGLLLMQKKVEYKADYGRSPDNADAFILTFGKTNKARALLNNRPTQAVRKSPFRR